MHKRCGGTTEGGMMRILLTAILTIMTAGAAMAQSTCNQLWVERNSYYKAAGYCFTTQRAIAYFGNAGCRFTNQNSVPLSAATRKRIAQIVAQERSLGCSD